VIKLNQSSLLRCYTLSISDICFSNFDGSSRGALVVASNRSQPHCVVKLICAFFSNVLLSRLSVDLQVNEHCLASLAFTANQASFPGILKSMQAFCSVAKQIEKQFIA